MTGLFYISLSCNKVKDNPELTWVNQNWSERIRNDWYTTSQGSELFPYDWFIALEGPGSEDLFINGMITRYGFIPGPVSKEKNPDNLPLGFVLDTDDRDFGDGIKLTRWAGLNCAACHTSAISHPDDSEKILILDGGQPNFEFETFRNDLLSSVNETYNNKNKFERFAKKVLENVNNKLSHDEIYEQLKLVADRVNKINSSNKSVIPAGHGRIDAFGAIFNVVSFMNLEIPANLQPVIAPVNMPFIWYLHRQDYTQWGGQNENKTADDHLGRNMGEVLGVFARINVDTSIRGFPSSIKIVKLLELEYWLKDLRSPQWPEEILGKIDRPASLRGEVVFNNHCKGCHSIVSKDSDNVVQIRQHPLSEIGTDSSWNEQYVRTAVAGVLQGQPLLGEYGSKIDSITLAANLLVNQVSNAVMFHDVPGKLLDYYTLRPINGYKAPILNGVWATSPYFHNGSAANLHEVLIAPEARKKTFYKGTLGYDPVSVGYKTDVSETNRELFDTSLPGNRNTGHGFGAKLTEKERRDLIEYLKTL